MAASGLVCMDAELKFMRINKLCHAYTDSHAQRIAASLLGREDAAVFVSYSGQTREILEAADIALKTGASIIAITKSGKSDLAEKADIVINISSPEITIRSGAMGSRIAMLNVIDILFTGVASAEYNRVRRYLTRTLQVVRGQNSERF